MEEPESSGWNYCRFCAERKDSKKLMKFDYNSCQLNQVISKLNILNLELYNTENCDFLLPNTICFVCWSKFNSAYEFHETFHQAQTVLKGLHPINNNSEKLSEKKDLHSVSSGFTSPKATSLITYGSHKTKHSNNDTTSEICPIKSEPDESLESEKCSESEIMVQDCAMGVIYTQDVKSDSINSETGPSFNKITINADDPYDDGTAEDCDNFSKLLVSSCNETDATPNIGFYAEELSSEPKLNIKCWKEYPWICFYCSIVLPDIESLREHSKLEHSKCAAFKCIDCVDSHCEIHDFQAFLRHVRKHRKHLRKVCPYCDIKTVSYKSHMKLHYTNPSLKCQACGELFTNEDQYTEHMLLSSTNNNKNIKEELKPKKKRRKPHQIITKADLTCPICQKVYRNLNSLGDHKRAQHSTESRRIYTCEKCGKSFLSKGTLTTHIMGHNKIKPYQCRLCDKAFKFPNLLRRHVDTHSGVKRFKCDQCGRAFRLLYQLNNHKIVHTDAMPYVCQYCSKAFKFKSILDIHERQHTGAKPYACNECGMEFTNWSNYNKHSKRRHGTDLSKKKITPLGSFPVNPETGKVMELDNSVACEEWKKQVMMPRKRGPKKGFKTPTEAARRPIQT